jgi:hypothetical protein
MAGVEERLTRALESKEFQEVATILDQAELEVRQRALRGGRAQQGP